MRKLNDNDLTNIAGSTVGSYKVECVRIKRGEFTDSDHYGIILGRNTEDSYVTWQFHLGEDEKVDPYWGHYFNDDREVALRDFNIRDLNVSPFKVTITETLQKTVDVEARDQHEAEQIISDNWKKSQYVLDADDFIGVEFKAAPMDEPEDK